MSVTLRPNSDGTTSILNTSGTEVLKVPATQSMPDNTIATLSNAGGVGIGQTWQNVTASRALGTTYTNTTGKPITLIIGLDGLNSTANMVIDGIISIPINRAGHYAANDIKPATFLIPNSRTYSLNNISAATISYWFELR